jgi:hypothetical protein
MQQEGLGDPRMRCETDGELLYPVIIRVNKGLLKRGDHINQAGRGK